MAIDEDAIGFDEPATKTIGLCMIVKDEAAVIERCLDSVRPLIDYVLIEDTGSTDGTQELIRAYLRRHGIPGEVIEEKWRDFAYNRSHAMARLREKASVDYALIMDADDRLVIAPGFDAEGFKAGLWADLYHVWIRLGSTRYHRPQICSNRLGFHFRGIVHEFLEGPPDGHSSETAEGFYVAAGVEGARSNDPDKYRKDAQALERALAAETDAFMRTRYTLYLAQSWRDCGENAKSVAAYLERAEQGGWNEEVFISLCNAGKLQEALGEPIETVVATLRRATDLVPHRNEARHAAARACRLAGRNELGCDIARSGLDLPEPASGLFIEPWVYQYGLLDEFAINAFWTGRHRESLDACERLLRIAAMPPAERARVLQNAEFAYQRMAPEGAEPAIRSQGPAGTGLARHLRRAFDRAMAREAIFDASLPGFESPPDAPDRLDSGRKFRMLVNRLIAEIGGARYLEIGSAAGSTLCTAVSGNRVSATAIGGWPAGGEAAQLFMRNAGRFLGTGARLTILEGDFRAVDYDGLGKSNVFLYAGPHDERDHRDAIDLVLPALGESFVLIVGDWNWDHVRRGTFDAIGENGLAVDLAIEVRTTSDGTTPQFRGGDTDWHNGYLFAVLTGNRRSVSTGEAAFDKIVQLLGVSVSGERRAEILNKLAAADQLPGGVDPATLNHVGDGRIGKHADAPTSDRQAAIAERTHEFFAYSGHDMTPETREKTFKSCPVCGASETTKPRPDLGSHPYHRCSGCGLFYQPHMRTKVFEGHHEARGDTMSESDRAGNLALARALYHNHLAPKFGTEPLLHLDIGSKYPFFGHCLRTVAQDAGRPLFSHGIDGIAEAHEFGRQLGVLMAVGDFEADPPSWDMPQAMRDRIANGGFHCISLIHCLEHFYDPLRALRQVRRLMRTGGVVFIRSPDSQAPGIEQDFTDGHYSIHPTIWCESAMRSALAELGDIFEIDEHYQLAHQRDYLLRAGGPGSAAQTGSSGVGARAGIREVEPRSINILRPGAIGDVLASGAITAQLAARFPDAPVRYYTKTPEMAQLLVGVDQVFDADEWDRREPGLDLWLTGYPLGEGYPETPMRKHLVAYFCDEAGVPFGKPQLKEPEPFAIGRPSWVTLHPKAGWSAYKEWPLDNWNAVVARFHEACPDIAVAQIGGAGDTPIEGIDCDLRGRTSISQAVWLVKHSVLHLGVDSFTNHAAGAFEHPAVIVFGSTSPMGSGYDTAINLWAGLGCSPCYREDPAISRQSRGPCINPPGQEYAEPRHACMAAITVDQVWEAVVRLLHLRPTTRAPQTTDLSAAAGGLVLT
jgi:ADP-heptose:LPS heptosyltransferase